MKNYQTKEKVERLCNVLDSGEVMRFHATPSVPCQFVAQHAWGVSVIASFIKTDPRPDFIMECLGHDMEELYTGDIPFTTKRRSKLLKDTLEELELEYRSENLFDHFLITEAEKVVLKISDMLEGLRWACLNERLNRTQVSDRWFFALSDVFISQNIELLDSEERERAYEIFRRVSPDHHKHRVYLSHSSLFKSHQL